MNRQVIIGAPQINGGDMFLYTSFLNGTTFVDNSFIFIDFSVANDFESIESFIEGEVNSFSSLNGWTINKWSWWYPNDVTTSFHGLLTSLDKTKLNSLAVQVNSDWNAASGFPQILNKPSLATVATSGSYADLSSKPTIPAAQIQSDWTQVTTGAPDYIKNKPSIPSGTVTSVGLTSTDFSVSGSPVTNSGSITANLNTSGVSAGTYSGVTVTSKGIVTAGTNRSFSSPTLTLGTAYQPSSTRDCQVTVSVEQSTTLSLSGGQSCNAFLEYADDSGFTTNVKEIGRSTNGNTGTLTIGLNITQTNTATITGMVPASKYYRVRTTGTGTQTFRSAQEVLL